MYSAQCLEASLIILITALGFERSNSDDVNQFDDLHGYRYRQPLGNLIRRLQNETKVPSDLENRLDQALAARKWLAHRCFVERFIDWFLPTHISKMTKKLTEMQWNFDKVAHEVDQLQERLCQKAKQDIQKVLEKSESEIIPALLKVYEAQDEMRHNRRRKTT